MRTRSVARSLENLKVESGTGPDELAARVLKLCARQLAVPVAKLIRRILSQGFWPSEWTIHWLMPLHKRKSVSDPGNYRAINLTAQVSKVVERLLSQFFVPTLERRAFGVAQFAYRQKARRTRRSVLLRFVLGERFEHRFEDRRVLLRCPRCVRQSRHGLFVAQVVVFEFECSFVACD